MRSSWRQSLQHTAMTRGSYHYHQTPSDLDPQQRPLAVDLHSHSLVSKLHRQHIASMSYRHLNISNSLSMIYMYSEYNVLSYNSISCPLHTLTSLTTQVRMVTIKHWNMSLSHHKKTYHLYITITDPITSQSILMSTAVHTLVNSNNRRRSHNTCQMSMNDLHFWFGFNSVVCLQKLWSHFCSEMKDTYAYKFSWRNVSTVMCFGSSWQWQSSTMWSDMNWDAQIKLNGQIMGV